MLECNFKEMICYQSKVAQCICMYYGMYLKILHVFCRGLEIANMTPFCVIFQDDNEIKRNKMAAKAKAWEAEFARKCQPLKPVCIGCGWTSLSGEDGDNLSKDEGFLQQFAAVALADLPLSVAAKKETKELMENISGSSELTRMPVPEEGQYNILSCINMSLYNIIYYIYFYIACMIIIISEHNM